jgi:hypothetical protein
MRPTPPIALALMLAASPAFACSGKSVYLEGDLKLGDQGWGQTDQRFQVKGAEAVLTPEPGTQNARWDTVASLTDADVCVNITMPAASTDASRTYAGLLFWLTDKDNFYQAVIAPNGLLTVARKSEGKISATAPVTWTKAEAMKLGPDAKNALRVTIDGSTVIITLNDAEVARFQGQAPQSPSHIGLVAASPPDKPNVWRMADLKATNIADRPATATAPSAAASHADDIATGAVPTAAGCADGKTLFQDRFTSHDQAWGPKDKRLTISGGVAAFSPEPGTGMFRWNRAYAFDDVDVCASVRLAKNTPDPTASYAGLLFWVKDNKNYYQAVIAPNGYFTVARVVDGKVEAKRPVQWTQLDAVKKGAKEKNTMRVTAKGDQVAIVINGKEVATFKGEPPKAPSHIGMFAASGPNKPGDTWSISDLKVTALQ